MCGNWSLIVLGVFVEAQWDKKGGWFGDGNTFCFTFEPAFRTFSWTGNNNSFVHVDHEHGLGFGAGGGFALWFDVNFENGSTAKNCATFGNDQLLASSEDFGCISVEVWKIGR